jgi:hypothetical protein
MGPNAPIILISQPEVKKKYLKIFLSEENVYGKTLSIQE